MATTIQTWLDAAYGKSLKNRPGEIATNATELYNVGVRILRGLFAIGARINPGFYGGSSTVGFASPGWARPTGAESIDYIESAPGVEVVVVDSLQRDAEPGTPAVYAWGQVYRPASAAAINPQAGNLTFFYSRVAPAPATITDVIDSQWPEQFNELPQLEIALYLANKDGRADEVPGYTADRDRWLTLYVAFLEHETGNVRRRYATRRFSAPSMVAIKALLAGTG